MRELRIRNRIGVNQSGLAKAPSITRRHNMRPNAPFFSIVVPTYNRPFQLMNCLGALAELDYPRACFEVIVVDDGSTLSLHEIEEAFSAKLSLVFVRQANAGPAAARNTGARHAKGQYIAMTDDDCAPASDWLTCLARQLEKDPTQLYGGRILNGLPGNRYAVVSQTILEEAYAWHRTAEGFPRFFATNNVAVSADSFHKIGGFHETFRNAGAEDREFCDRWLHNRHPMAYVPDAIVYHRHDLNLRKLLRQQFNYGCGAFNFYRLQSERGWGRFQFHKSFYQGLFLRSLNGRGGDRALLLALLSCAQLAVAGGYFWQKLTRNQ